MRHCWLMGLSLIAFGLIGCMSDDANNDFFHKRAGTKYSIPPRDKLPAGSTAAATQVDSIGRQILAANPDMGIRPMFLTIGVAEVTAFHRGANELYVSDGLVSKCKSDSELAAIMSAELGKMVAEAQTKAPKRFSAEREPPYSPNVGNNVVGGHNDPDQTNLAEQAFWEKRNPRRDTRAAQGATLEPDVLAKMYMTKAGFTADDVERMAPLIRQAEANPVFEKQMSGPGSK